MKFVERLSFFTLLLLISLQSAFGQSTGDFRSAGTGNWNVAATWERFDGSNWVVPAAGPTSSDGTVAIQNGHVVTITANVTVDQVTINSGGQAILNSGITLTINNGTGTDFTVSGTFTSAGTITNNGTMAYNAGGMYRHNYTTTAGSIPTATWNAASTVEVIGYTTNTGTLTGLSQSFGNFTWNSPSQTGNISAGGSLQTVTGTLSILSTGTGAFRLTTTSSPTLNITGNMVISGGTFVLANSTGAPTVNLTGNLQMTGGTLRMLESSGLATLNVTGDFSHAGGTITEIGSVVPVIRFVKAGTQSYTSGGTVTNTVNFTVNSGSTLNMGTNVITGGGTFTLSSGATLGIGSPDGITTVASGAIGNIQTTGGRSYNTGAHYTYNGLAAQVTGNGLPATVNNLTLDNAAGLTLGAAQTVSGNLLISQGTLSTNNFNITEAGNWTNNGGFAGGTSTITFSGASKSIGGSSVTTFPGLVIATGASTTLNTNAIASSLTFNSGSSASSLTHSNGISLNVTGNATINQPTASVTAGWNINAGSATVGGNLTIGGTFNTSTQVAQAVVTSGSLLVSGTTTLNVGTSSAVARIAVDTGTLTFDGFTHNEGTLAFTAAGTINFTSPYSFASGGSATPIFTTVSGANLNFNNNLTSSATGGLTLNSGSNTSFSGTLAITPTTAITFGNVQLNAGSNVTLNGNITLAGNWTNNGGTFNADSHTMTLSGATKTIGGTSSTAFPILSLATGSSFTMNNNNSSAGLIIIAGASATSFTHGGTSVLTVNGNVSINQPTGSVTNAWNINQGSATVSGNVDIGGSNTTTARVSRIVITTGSMIISGNLTFNSSGTTAQTAVLDLSTGGATGTVNLGGLFTLTNNTGTLLAGTSGSIFSYSGTSAQVARIGSSIVYHNLHINSTVNATLSAAVTASNVTGNLRVQSGTLDNGGFAIAGNGTRTFEVANGATFRLGGSTAMVTGFGTKSFGPSSTVNYAGSGAQTVAAENYGNLTLSGTRTTNNLTLASTGTIGIAGALTASASFTTGNYVITGSTVDFNLAGAQTVGAFNYNNLVISGARGANNVTLVNGGTIGITGTLSAPATFGGGGYVNTNNTISFNGAAQSIPVFGYFNLSTAGGGIKTPTGALTIDGGLTIGSGTTLNSGAFTHGVKGNFAQIGTFSSGSGTILLNGVGLQTISGTSPTFNNLTMSNSSGAALNNTDAIINGTLTFVSGVLSTGTNIVMLPISGNIVRSAGHVNGNLQKSVGTGSSTLTFDVGDASLYSPVMFALNGVLTGGDLVVRAVNGDHPNIALSGIKSNKSVNRHWIITNNGVSFSNYDATFSFNPSDVDGGATTGAFIVKKYNVPVWSLTTTGTRTATSTQAVGLTSFSDFAVGEGGAAFPPTSLITASPQSITANGTSTSTIAAQLKDDQGNNLTSGGDSVTLAATLGILGSVTDNGNGTYTAILTSDTVTGSAVISGTANGGIITDKDTVVFVPGPASLARSLITANPAAIVANGTDTSHITIQLKDQFGNNLTSGAGTVALTTTKGTLGSVTNHNNGTYSARLTASLVLGPAVVKGTLNAVAIADSEVVAFTTAQPSQLVWTNQPHDTTAGNPIPSNSPMMVEIRDPLNNLVTSATNPVTLTIGNNPAGATLGGTVTQNAVGGIATFNNISINKSANGYTLIASSGSLTPDTSVAFNILPGAATQIGFIQQPTTTIAENIISPPVTVGVRDNLGNTVPMAGISISLVMTTGTGTLAGTTTRITDSTGVATFDDLAINTQGSKRFTASASGFANVLSNTFTINPQPSILMSDDFNGFGIHPMWTPVNPFGVASIAATQTNTPNASMTFSVPSTQAHDLGGGILQVVRIMQQANNTDFQVEVKWLTGVSERFELQGVVVEFDSINYMRFDIYSDALATKAFVGSIVNGVQTQLVNLTIGAIGITPTYMRVRRVGDNWTQFYSTDGISWSPTGTFARAMVVNKVGPYVGNTGTPIPAHTGSIDYFMNLASPILNEDGTTAVDSIPPVITNIQMTPGDTSATVTWITDEPSTSLVEWGLTPAYGSSTPLDTNKVTNHSVNFGGLADQTLYHFRVSSADVFGNNKNSNNATFATKDSFLVASDDFNTFSLKPFWTFSNPQSDGSLSFTGQNTANAWAVINVPGGSPHESWTTGNNAIKLLQTANNRDFELEAKFETGVSQAFQEQGIIIQQDNIRFLRFEFYSTGTNTRAFAGSRSGATGTTHFNANILANGATPLYMRVKRLGHQWTQSYSTNGTTWNPVVTFSDTLVVTSVGPYAGNSATVPANTPAFTSQIDYFFKTNKPVVPEDGGIAIDNVPPVISNIQTSTTGTTATLTWTTNELTRSVVSYGPTALYENGNVIDSLLSTNHSMTIKGLDPASLYHFRIAATDSSNNTTNSNDSTFTTGAASTIASDDFNAFILHNRWTYFNPKSDATLSMNNTNTDSARVFISVPGGISHDPWTGGNFAPRIMQACNNADFEVQVKFESPVTVGFQIQGIIVEQDQNNYLRFDINSNSTNTKAFAASVTGGTATQRIASTTIGANGVAPQYMRVKREGNLWTQSVSLNGSTWTTIGTFTHTLVVDSIGPFIGNAMGTSIPAHTAKIDYFFNTRSPISPEDGGFAPDPFPPVISNVQVVRGTTYATVTWTTNEAATSAVSFGPTTAYENGTIADSARVLNHTIQLTGLTIGTLYHFRVMSADSTGNVANKPDSTFTTLPLSNIVSDDFNQASLNASLWTFLNPRGDAALTMNNTNTDSARVFIAVPAGLKHDIWSDGKTAPRIMQRANNTDFEIKVKFESRVNQNTQLQGVLIQQSPTDFVRVDFNSNGTITRLFAATFVGMTPTTRINNTNIGAAGIVPQWLRVKREINQWTVFYSFNDSAWTQAGTFAHTLTVDSVGIFIGNVGTTPSNSPAHTGKVDYFFNMASPIANEDGVGPPPDTVAPVISNVQTVSHLNSFDVSWATNEPASGLVEYGLTTGYELGSVSDTNKTLGHNLTINGLQTGTLYHFRITAKDTLNQTRVSSDFTVRTRSILTVNVAGSGSVAKNPDSSNYLPGQIVGMKATPASGWHFIGWSGDTTSTSDTLAITMNGNRTVTATFDTNRILTVNIAGNGSVTKNPNLSVYSTGQAVGLKANAASGWHFIGWSGDTTATSDTLDITMNSNRTVTATFDTNRILNVNISGNGSVAKNPDKPFYSTGESVTLTAIPSAGWFFSSWSGDTATSSNPVTIVMISDKSVLAAFLVIPPVVANVKAFLQGPYDAAGDSLRTDLNGLSSLPLSQPYNIAPWNYSGTESVGSIPPGAVDWVLVEIRPSSDSTQVLATRAAFILRSGMIVDTNGTSAVGFAGQGNGNYFVVLRHRNHLATMSSTTLTLTTTSALYNFTTSQSQAYGTDAMSEIETGVFGLRGGDGNADGGIDAVDRNLFWRPQNGTAWDYTKYADFDLDGDIDAVDLNLHWRPNNGTATQVPGSPATRPIRKEKNQ